MTRHGALARRLPGPLRRHVLHFESAMEDAVTEFAATVPEGGRVLDAGAGEARHGRLFPGRRYVAVDSAVGDSQWDYSRLDCRAGLCRLPFRDAVFDAALNLVTLEHVREPATALREIWRVLKPGARLLVVVPHAWEVHQAPNDFYRYTCHGLEYLTHQAGFATAEIRPVGGYFRLLARRLLNGLQFFPPLLMPLAALLFVPPALLLPLLDPLDRDQRFTLGYICTVEKRS